MKALALNPEIEAALATNAPVAVSISGGKDSTALAYAIRQYLDAIGHAGPQIAIHADLGLIEWPETDDVVKQTAERCGFPLQIVRRNLGGMIPRWVQRWRDNVARYKNLELTKVAGPWSSAKLRFCTSELKVSPICSWLKKQYPGQTIINVTGIRAEESKGRASAPITKVEPKLKGRGTTNGITWNPLLTWTKEDVFELIKIANLPLHPAYSQYGSTRLSCSFCILASFGDLCASTRNPGNTESYRQITGLEIESGFSFQPSRWLSTINPQGAVGDLAGAQARARERHELEDRIPESLRLKRGMPVAIPTMDDFKILAEVRQGIAKLYGWTDMQFTTASSIATEYMNRLI